MKLVPVDTNNCESTGLKELNCFNYCMHHRLNIFVRSTTRSLLHMNIGFLIVKHFKYCINGCIFQLKQDVFVKHQYPCNGHFFENCDLDI